MDQVRILRLTSALQCCPSSRPRANSMPVVLMTMSICLMLLSACADVPSHRSEQGRSPYPMSRYIRQVKWDFSTVVTDRRAHGSDLWPCTWAADRNLYCAWGDGGGFDGDDDHIGR